MKILSVIERRIREAQEQGKFRDLQGEGARQKLEDNPFEDPEMRPAYKVLSNGGYCLPWMDLIKEIDTEIAAAEQVWANYRLHRRRQMNSIHRGTVASFAETVSEIDRARNRALDRLEKRWTEINKKIAHLNATVPVDSLRRLTIRVDHRRREFELEFPSLAGLTAR